MILTRILIPLFFHLYSGLKGKQKAFSISLNEMESSQVKKGNMNQEWKQNAYPNPISNLESKTLSALRGKPFLTSPQCFK